jgi:hypothetical protein
MPGLGSPGLTGMLPAIPIDMPLVDGMLKLNGPETPRVAGFEAGLPPMGEADVLGDKNGCCWFPGRRLLDGDCPSNEMF